MIPGSKPPKPFSRRRDMGMVVGGLFLLLIAWAGSAVTLRSIDRGKPAGWDQASLLYLPSGQLLRPMAMDLDEGLAALLWVRGILYFSDAYLNRQGYEWLAHILETVTTLNPHFLAAYEFTGNVLGKKKGEWPKVEKILKRGVGVYPSNWQIRLSLAMGRVKIDSNYVAAAKVLEEIATLPGVPTHIRTLSATFLEIGGEEKLAIGFLVNRYLSISDALTRDLFVDRILKFDREKWESPSKRKKTIYKILSLALADARSEGLVNTVLLEFLYGNISPGSKRVLGVLGE